MCYRCFKPQLTCICAEIQPVANRTGVTILQHPNEQFHAVGTARIARLGLRHARLLRCAPWEDSGRVRARIPDGAALLYPVDEAREVASLGEAERPRHLVVLDGTWFHARKMYQANAWLADLPALKLTPTRPSRYRIRREPKVGYIATIEAIIEALQILEPDTRGFEGLLDVFEKMVDRQARHLLRNGRTFEIAVRATV
jgi:DTW domain-containing protein YfiP